VGLTLQIYIDIWQNKVKKSLNYYWSYEKFDNIIDEKDRKYNTLRTIDKYDINGNFIKSYNTLKEAALEHPDKKSVRIKRALISSCCRNQVLHVNNFVYKYSKVEKEKNKKAIVVNISKRYPPLYQYDLYGEFVQEYENIETASKMTKIHRSSIDRQLSKSRESSKLGYWSHTKYKNILKETPNNVKFIFKYDLAGKYVKHFATMREAIVDCNRGFSYESERTAICNCLNGKMSHINSYTYKYNTLNNQNN